MMVRPLASRVEYSERTRILSVAQNALVACHQPCTHTACSSHKNAVCWITVRFSRKTGASNSNVWRQPDHLYARSCYGSFDPLERLRGESYPALLDQHRYFPHRYGRNEQEAVLARDVYGLQYSGRHLILSLLPCPHPDMGIEQQRQVERVTYWHPTPHLWVRSGRRRKAPCRACNQPHWGTSPQTEPASRPAFRAW